MALVPARTRSMKFPATAAPHPECGANGNPLSLQIRSTAMQSRRMLPISLTMLAGLGLSTPAHTQAWPERPVVIVVPFAAGGNTDGIARMTAQRLGAAFGQQFVVENRGGAGGATAAEVAARAEPNGYTLFMAALPVMAIVPAMTKARYNSTKDFAPISN